MAVSVRGVETFLAYGAALRGDADILEGFLKDLFGEKVVVVVRCESQKDDVVSRQI